MEFKKAVKTQQKLRLAIDGVSGSGKTYTALAIAKGMGGRIAVIDTEHGSAALYADRFDFDTLELLRFEIEDYIEALKAAEAAGYGIVIIDSTSHAWDALLDRVEKIAQKSYKDNSFRAWAEGTPMQRRLIEAMLSYPGHVIVTCRSKSEYAVDKDENGKTTIKKVGTAAVQRQGFEYEFTMAMTMDADHFANITKDRTGKFQDQYIEKPGEDFGRELIAWLNEGAVDYHLLCKEKLNELGNILKSIHEGKAVFTEPEIAKIRQCVKEVMERPPETRVSVLEEILEETKAELRKRIEAAPVAPPTVPPPQAAPVVTEAPAAPTQTPPAAAQVIGRPGSLVEAFYQRIAEPPKPAAADDDFEDDIPWEAPPAAPIGKPEIF